MPYTAGNFTPYTPGNPVVTNTTISIAWANNTINDIATGLSTCILKDGSQTITGNIPFSNFKITGLAAGTAATDAATVAQIQGSLPQYLTAVGGTGDAITATATPVATLAIGQVYRFISAAANTTATTLKIGSNTAGAIQSNGAALVGGEIQSGQEIEVFVSAATPVFQLIGNGATFPFIDSLPLVHGSADATKKIRFEVDGLTTATTRVYTPPDFNMQMGDGQIIAVGRNIAARTNSGTPNTKLDISADEICVRDTNGTSKLLSSVSGTIDFGTTGANGLDASTQASSTWYYGWVIWNPATNTTAVLGSLSSSSPTMPSGYTFKALATAARSDGATHFIKYRQFGNRAHLEASQNVLNSAAVGTGETTVSLSSFVPPNAEEAILQLYGSASASGTISAQATLRVVTGSVRNNIQIQQSTGNASAFGYETTVPNISQQVFVAFSNTTNFSSSQYTVDVLGFKLPLGGE